MINNGDYNDFYQGYAEQLLEEYDPSINNAKSCCSCCCTSFALLSRFVIRNTIPIVFGFGSGIGVKLLSEFINSKTLKSYIVQEASNVVSCCVTLLFAYGIDFLLNKCWPAKPSHTGRSNFFHTPPERIDFSSIPNYRSINRTRNRQTRIQPLGGGMQA